MQEVKKCIVTDLDFDSQKRRAEVIVVSTRASDTDKKDGTADDSGYLNAQVRYALARFGVREAWATVEVEYAAADDGGLVCPPCGPGGPGGGGTIRAQPGLRGMPMGMPGRAPGVRASSFAPPPMWSCC